MTVPSDKEAPSPTRGPGTTATPSRVDARGLIALRATTTSLTIASGTSVSHIHFDFSLTTQACPHTYIGSSIATET